MRVEKIGKDVWKFKGRTCVYLIKGKSNVLIDAGDPDDWEELGEAISGVLNLDEIDCVLLTHLHYDHVGCIGLFSNARIFAGAEEIEDYVRNAKKFHYFASEESDKILRKRLEPFPLEMMKAEGSGQKADFLGLEVLNVPGHTRGSVAFLDKERKLLFSGDTIFAGDVIGRTDLPNSVELKMGGSVKRLRELEREGFRVLAGHGY